MILGNFCILHPGRILLCVLVTAFLILLPNKSHYSALGNLIILVGSDASNLIKGI